MSEPIQSISQGNYILATQQEVSHDNTLSGNGTSASPLGLNETVLWEGECNWWDASTISNGLDVSEDFSNFEYIKVLSRDDWELREHWTEFRSKPTGNQFTIAHVGPEGGKLTFKTGLFNLSGHHISVSSGCMMNVNSAGAHNFDFTKAYIQFLKIIGINRKVQ